jgi:amidase
LFADFIRAILGRVISSFIGDPKLASILTSTRKVSVYQYNKYVAEKVAFERQTREALWGGDNPIDVVLAPVQAIPALPHNSFHRISAVGSATMIWNVVESSVGVVPITRVDPARDDLSEEWRAIPSDGSKICDGELYGPNGVYNPSALKGLPVGVQVVCKPWEEEKVLAIMRIIDVALGPRGFHPGSWSPDKQAGGAQESKKDE